MTTFPGETAAANPYRPGVGTRPLVLAGRDEEVRAFRGVLRAAPDIPANVRITGLRGVGKTVLLTELEKEGQAADWATALIELEPRHNTDDALISAIRDRCERAKQRLSMLASVRARVAGVAAAAASRVKVAWGEIELSFDPGDASLEADLSKVLFDSVDAALDANRSGFVLLLDEAQVIRDDREGSGNHPLSVLLAAVSALQRAEVPLALIVCGLPTLTTNLLRARTYSERMFRGMPIASLPLDAAREAFLGPLEGTGVSAEDSLVARVLDTVEGYPYFIQLWGAELWDAASEAHANELTATLLDTVQPHIYRRLDLDFYEPRVQTLTPAEQDLLLMAARCPYPPLRVAQLQHVATKTPGNVNVLLGRLVEAGVLYRLRKGDYGYAAPKFYDFLRRRAASQPFDETGQLSWTGASDVRVEVEHSTSASTS